ncbi:DUF1232 domain-containing protein [bacterium]|nr:DUF1232 domain-containing protein [candidate division CSSED10-310 bacterium]
MKSANPRHWDYYRRLRVKMKQYTGQSGNPKHTISELLMVAPDLFHLAICLMGDPDVPLKFKAKLGAAIAYFISPIDLLPELLLGPFGYIDDIAILAWVLNSMLNQIDQDIVLRYWAGDSTVLTTIQRIIDTTDKLLGKGLLKKIKSSFGRSTHHE